MIVYIFLILHIKTNKEKKENYKKKFFLFSGLYQKR